MNTVHLIGSEEVSRAGHNISGAAETISRAASSFDNTAEHLREHLEEHAQRIEAAMAMPAPRKCTVFKKVQNEQRLWVNVEHGPAQFVCWGQEYEEFENGVGNVTVAVVEFPDGTVDTVLPSLIKFEVPS